MNTTHPTPYPELNTVLLRLVNDAQNLLGDNFTGAYLQGSFAVGDFDEDSDVDFLVITEDEVSEADVAALQAMHGSIYDLESAWAKHLEGSYIPKDELRNYDKEALRHFDPARRQYLYLDNCSRELIRSTHDNTLVVRWVLRQRGITLAGPEPKTLMDPISGDDLRQEIRATMAAWARQLKAAPEQMNNRWYQPFAVLSYCRMLHTLHTGVIESKPAAAQWAKTALDSSWADLIQRDWDERPDPFLKVQQKADPDDFKSTFEFIEYSLKHAARPELSHNQCK